MKVSIDRDVCAGHGMCYAHAPDLITDDDLGYGQVIGDGVVPSDRVDAARAAVANCPEHAVTVNE